LLLLMFWQVSTSAQQSDDNLFQVRGFCIGTPGPKGVDRFVKFINEELSTRGVNTLVLLVDYNYQFESYPQLRDSDALSKADAKKIVAVCRKNKIRIIPQINMLGHQSWENHTGKLLEQFPQFDETPQIKMPEKYVWPNDDFLYCKSYCPLYPDLHNVTLAIIDGLCDAFETDAFHAGMDGIFYLGDDKCPWRTPTTSVIQTEDMARFRKYATPEMKPRYYGMMQTTWMNPEGFIDGFYGKISDNAKKAIHPENETFTPWDTFKAMFKRMDELDKENK
jgi:hypothetical protein